MSVIVAASPADCRSLSCIFTPFIEIGSILLGLLLWIVRWLLGADLKATGHSGETFGGHAVATLLTILVVTVAGFLVYLKDKPDPEWKVYISYASLCVVVLVAALIMLCGRGKRKRGYDVGTLMLARWAVIASILSMFGVGGLYFARALPNQELREVPLLVSNTKEEKWKPYPELGIKKDDSKLLVDVLFAPATLGVKPREPQDFEITLSDKVAWSWELTPTVSGYRIAGEQRVGVKPSPHTITNSPTRLKLLWRGVQATGEYVLQVRLHQRSPQISPNQLQEMIKNDPKGIVCTILVLER